ncbi:MAG: VOC family protein [Rhodothermales bacterium]
MEAHSSIHPHAYTIDPRVRMGAVTLAVSDLERMSGFYRVVIGLDLLVRTDDEAMLGAGGVPLVHLVRREGGRAEPGSTGLYHLALLLPSQADLGAWLAHLAETGYRLDGAGDHFVSEALYLSDPEGNGIEVYRDRPREMWEYVEGLLRMGTERVDVRALLEAGAGVAWRGLPDGTTMGHVHLRVADIQATLRFYEQALGMQTMAFMPGAGFFSAGGYHHHIGANTWESRGAKPPSPGALGLVAASLVLPDDTTRDAFLRHLDAAGIARTVLFDRPAIQDPSGNTLLLTTP